MAKTLQDMVLEFHQKHGLPVGLAFPENQELRLRLIEEELDELYQAIEEQDAVKAMDAIGDLLYVVVGAAVTWSMPTEAIFAEVHRSNMTKDGGRRGDGKLMKGAGFEEPDLIAALVNYWHGNDSTNCPRCCSQASLVEATLGPRTCHVCGWGEEDE